MPLFNLTINNKSYSIESEGDMPLLWAIRDFAGLTGTKFSCGIAQCGACTVHIEGKPVRSCTFPVAAAVDLPITTIEGLSENNDHPVQKAWIEAQVPQCGYCQSGQIMTVAALLDENANPSPEEIDQALQNVLCRCGTYPRIKKAIQSLTKES